MSNKEIAFGDAKFVKYATEETDAIIWHDCLGSLNLTFKELSDKISRGELPVGTTIAAVFNKTLIEKTKPIWNWEDKIAGRLPEVGATVLGSLDCECVILGADIKDRTVAVQYQDGQLQKLNIHYINPVETSQEKYNREMEEYVKAIADKDPVCRHSIYDFEEGVKAAYKQFKPFQEDKEG